MDAWRSVWLRSGLERTRCSPRRTKKEGEEDENRLDSDRGKERTKGANERLADRARGRHAYIGLGDRGRHGPPWRQIILIPPRPGVPGSGPPSRAAQPIHARRCPRPCPPRGANGTRAFAGHRSAMASRLLPSRLCPPPSATPHAKITGTQCPPSPSIMPPSFGPLHLHHPQMPLACLSHRFTYFQAASPAPYQTAG